VKAGKIKFLSFVLWMIPLMVQAQSLQGRISTAITDMISILNLLLVAAIAWAGFLMAKGDGSAVTRLIYCVVGLIVVNSSRLIIDYFLY